MSCSTSCFHDNACQASAQQLVPERFRLEASRAFIECFSRAKGRLPYVLTWFGLETSAALCDAAWRFVSQNAVMMQYPEAPGYQFAAVFPKTDEDSAWLPDGARALYDSHEAQTFESFVWVQLHVSISSRIRKKMRQKLGLAPDPGQQAQVQVHWRLESIAPTFAQMWRLQSQLVCRWPFACALFKTAVHYPNSDVEAREETRRACLRSGVPDMRSVLASADSGLTALELRPLQSQKELTGPDILRLQSPSDALEAPCLPLTQPLEFSKGVRSMCMWLGVSRTWRRLVAMFDLVVRVLWALGVDAHQDPSVYSASIMHLLGFGLNQPRVPDFLLSRCRRSMDLDSDDVRVLRDLLRAEHSSDSRDFSQIEDCDWLLTMCQPAVYGFVRRLHRRPFLETLHVLSSHGVIGRTFEPGLKAQDGLLKAKLDGLALSCSTRPRVLAMDSRLCNAYALLRYKQTLSREFPEEPRDASPPKNETKEAVRQSSSLGLDLQAKLKARKAQQAQLRRRK